ncbi:hypothetical protein [Candidatus Clostridium stratigraminis]|uniref:Uncharacterized protein n=1 Tax=Candidatus Clostridium stratigraminis TaxID=3381661 RepID=A0ABW8T6U8_9CLOT
MINNVFETSVMGSNIVYLNIPEEDYFLSYDSITRKAAEEISNTYFLLRSRDGIPEVLDIEHHEPSHRVKITLEVKEAKNNNRPLYKVPDSLNITRNNEVR